MDAARRVLQWAIADGAFPGATLAVLQHDSVAVEAFGRFTWDAQSASVEPGTCYDVASLTKGMATTAMAMLLWQRGILRLDMPLCDLLPAFAGLGSPGGSVRLARQAVTLAMLLAHASGLPAYVPFYQNCSSRESVLEAAMQLPLVTPPGSAFAYSDPGFILLSRALEVLAAESLDAFCAREIFKPLGMEETCFNPKLSERDSIPPTELDSGFRHRVIKGEVHDENCFALGGVAGHAGVFSNGRDLMRFSAAMLRPLRSTNGSLLFEPSTVRVFTTRQALPAGTTRTLGWDTPNSAGSSAGAHFSALSFGHLGFTGTSLWIDPVRELAVALLSNRTYPRRDNEKIRAARPLVHDALFQDIKSGHSCISRIV